MGKILVFLSFPFGLIIGFYFWTFVFKQTKKIDNKVAAIKKQKEIMENQEIQKVNEIRTKKLNINKDDDLIRY